MSEESDTFKHMSAAFTVLRSLGSAQTATNKESSRIGHFIEVQVTDNVLNRTKIHCYFLDQVKKEKKSASFCIVLLRLSFYGFGVSGCNFICVSVCWNMLKLIYSEKATNFSKSPPFICPMYCQSNNLVEISQNFVAFSEYMNFNFILVLEAGLIKTIKISFNRFFQWLVKTYKTSGAALKGLMKLKK